MTEIESPACLMDCKHKRYTVDVAEQTGRCMDCGAEGRMRFVVGDPVAAERERWTLLLTEKWHRGDGPKLTLGQYMGMGVDEYSAWVAGPNG